MGTLSWNRIFSEICYIICWTCTRTCSLDDPWVGYIGFHYSSSSSSTSVHLAIIKNDDAWYGRNRGRHIYKPCSLDWPEARLYRAPLFLHLLLTVILASSSIRFTNSEARDG